ncbi:MAG: saccharopine dehydrogenase NADP-binding domain-containing protein [Thaumarchaeota archaeon]|nr:saccharopine dehydrogenase NADP-binding domain-containing protein [Nitrososphaerota archaeon]
MPELKVVVLGGAGLTGSCAVRALAESPEVSAGLVADLDGEKARLVADSLGRGRFQGAAIDVRDVEATSAMIRGHDVVINAVQYYFNLQVMRAALKARVNYLDFGGLYHTTLKQLKLNGEFRSRNLLAVIGMGGEPGITNVLARKAADSMDRVSAVRIRDGSRDLTAGFSGYVVTWSLDTFLDELVLDAPVLERGRIITVPALSRSETVVFPKPIGSMETFVTIHSEVATLPNFLKSKGVKTVDWMEGSPDIRSLKLLVDLGLASTEEFDTGSGKVVPRKLLMSLIRSRNLIGYPKGVVPNDWEATRVLVEGSVAQKRTTKVFDVVIPPKPEWNMSCAQYAVGIPGSIAARMIGRGAIKDRGVVPPEACIPPDELIRELRGYGFKVASRLMAPAR